VDLRGEHALHGRLARGGRVAKGDEAGDAAHWRELGARSWEQGARSRSRIRGCGGRR
jgi:hypothetical protein